MDHENTISLKVRIQETLRKKLSAAELRKKTTEELLEELFVYYQELELQNEELQRVQQELEERTLQYEDLYENAPTGYAVYTQEGMLVNCNKQFRRWVGVEKTCAPHTSIQRFFTPECQDAFYLHVNQLLKTGTSDPCTLKLKTPNTPLMSVRLESNLFRDKKNNTLIRSAFIDITKEIETEKRVHELLEQLKEKNLQLQDFQIRLDTALSVGKIFWWSMEVPSGIVQFHPKKAINLGFSPTHFSHYSHFTNLVHPEDVTAAMQAMQNLLQGTMPHYSIEYRIQDASGNYRWYYDFGTITQRRPDQTPFLVQGITMDITDRKRIEQELQQQLSNSKSIIALLNGEYSSEEELLTFSFNEIMKLSGCDRGCLYNYSPDHDTLSIQTIVCRMEESIPCPSPSREILRELQSGEHFYLIRDDLLYIPIFYESHFRGLCVLKNPAIPMKENLFLQLNLFLHITWERLDKLKSDILKETYYQAIKDSPQPVVITDREGTITDVNEAFLRIYEYEARDVVGQNPRILNPGIDVYKNLGYSEEYYKTLFQEMWQSILDPTIGHWQGILINKKKSGTLVWVQIYISAIRDTSGNIQHFIGLPVDISTLKESEYRSKIELYRTIARLSELRDNETGNHMRRVGIYARLLSKALGMPEKFCEEMELFAPMHDIGKVGISDTILLVNRPLTQQEYEEIKKHTLLGYTIVRDKEELKTAADIILYHHERWDGKGYPYGLEGEAIPLSARITSVADVYDALRSKRPYKEEWPHEKAVQEIVKSSGHAFDPKIIQVFLQLAAQFDEVYKKLKD